MRTSVRWAKTNFDEKRRLLPTLFFDQNMGKSISVRFGGQATEVRAHGVNFGRGDQKRVLPLLHAMALSFLAPPKKEKALLL